MDVFKIVENLYINNHTDWIINLEEIDIEPLVILKFLAMDDGLRVQTRWLDKYTFSLPPKMFLSLAWSILPKVMKKPYIQYTKKVTEEEEFKFILDRIRKHFNLSDNDFNTNKDRLVKYIKNDMVNWFSFYGIPKKYWKEYYLDFDLIKQYGVVKQNVNNLSSWGI